MLKIHFYQGWSLGQVDVTHNWTELGKIDSSQQPELRGALTSFFINYQKFVHACLLSVFLHTSSLLCFQSCSIREKIWSQRAEYFCTLKSPTTGQQKLTLGILQISNGIVSEVCLLLPFQGETHQILFHWKDHRHISRTQVSYTWRATWHLVCQTVGNGILQVCVYGDLC